MNRAKEILNSCMENVQSPAKAIAAETERTGKRAVGCLLEFCPEELVYAAGMLPIGIWGADVELNEAKRYYPAFFCAPIQQSFELAARGAYDGLLAAVIVPILCDALKSAGQNWRIAVKNVPMIPLVYPQNRHIEAGRRFFVEELKSVRARLEEICGHTITDEAISESIAVYNEYRLALQAFAQEAPKHADLVTATARHSVFAAGFFRDKREHARIVRELTQELSRLPEAKPAHSVALTGIALDYPALLSALEENALTVTADTLAQESGQIDTLVPDGGTPLERLAAWWTRMRFSSLALDEKKERVDRMIELVRSGQAESIITAMPAFCDPEEYDYPVLHAALAAAGIPETVIELNDRRNCEQARSRIQALAEMLG